MLSLTLNQPLNNLSITLNQPFLVSGQVTDDGGAEPQMVDSVAVQVDGGAIIEAKLTHLPGKKVTRFAFSAWATVTGGQDPHTVTVTATDDSGRTAKKSVSVFTGPAFEVSPPAILLEINPSLNPNDPGIVRLVSEIQQALVPIAGSLAAVGKVLAGPNLFQTINDQGRDVLRVGLWVEDTSFPVLPADATHPLPRLLDLAAKQGFGLAPFLPLPSLTGQGPSFAVSIPTTTLQDLADSTLPGLKASAAQQDVTVDSITVTADAPGTVTVSIAGHAPLDLPFTATITETIGTQPVADADPPQAIPAVLNRTNHTSVPFVTWLIPLYNAYTLYVVLHLSSKTDREQGMMAALVDALPSRIPFANNAFDIPGGFSFPVLVPNWVTFAVTSTGVLGAGNSTIQERDESSVAVSVSGPGEIRGYQYDMAGGTVQQYEFSLTNLVPDPTGLVWTTSGTGTGQGDIPHGGLDQSGSFNADFSLPLKVAPGNHPSTLTVSATETCGTDPGKKLGASSSLGVLLEVIKNPKLPQ
jgi:hypothetical protein